MPSTVEKVDTNIFKITMSINPEKFEEGMKHSYNTNKGKISVPGFRKGKVPRHMVEKLYGREFLYDDAINHILPDIYMEAVKENKLEVVSKPKIDINEIDVEKGAVITAIVTVKPEVTVKNYKGLPYKKPNTDVTEQDIDDEIKKIQEKNSRIIAVTDRPLENGDISIIDFEGFVDGAAFDGGKGEDYELIIGSKTFIDNFEEQLIGLNVNDSKDVNVTFPENYGNPQLNGKNALFKVTIKEIKVKELPVADDEFAQDVSEFDTLDEYKDDFRLKLKEKKENEAKRDIETQVIEALSDSVEIDIPKDMIEAESTSILRNFERHMASQGVSLELYMKYTGITKEKMKQDNMEIAGKNVKGRLVLEAVAKAENYEVSQDEIEAEIDRMSAEFNLDREKFASVLQDEDIESLKQDIVVKKALDEVVKHAIAID